MSPIDLRHVQGVLFDLGGTLDGDGEHWLNRFWLLYQKHLPEVTFSELKAAFYRAEEVCLADPQVASLTLPRLVDFHVARQLAALGLGEAAAPKLSREFLEGCRQVIRRNAYLLHSLVNRYRLGVVTNWYGNAARLLAQEAIALWFAVIVDSAQVGVRKPDPAIFRLAAKELGFPPDQVVYVGDSYGQDIRPAKAAGLITVWLRNDAMSAPLPPDFDPALADFEIHRLTELEELLP
jgi:putative hydrolase of the HAD superfamily